MGLFLTQDPANRRLEGHLTPFHRILSAPHSSIFRVFALTLPPCYPGIRRHKVGKMSTSGKLGIKVIRFGQKRKPSLFERIKKALSLVIKK